MTIIYACRTIYFGCARTNPGRAAGRDRPIQHKPLESENLKTAIWSKTPRLQVHVIQPFSDKSDPPPITLPPWRVRTVKT